MRCNADLRKHPFCRLARPRTPLPDDPHFLLRFVNRYGWLFVYKSAINSCHYDHPIFGKISNTYLFILKMPFDNTDIQLMTRDEIGDGRGISDCNRRIDVWILSL